MGMLKWVEDSDCLLSYVLICDNDKSYNDNKLFSVVPKIKTLD